MRQLWLQLAMWLLLVASANSAHASSARAALFAALQANTPTNCYTVAVTGGHITPAGIYNNTDYATSNNPYTWDSYYSGDYDVQYGAASGSSASQSVCEGPISVTLTWHGPKPAPKSVLLQEACVVMANGATAGNGTGGSASVYNDLGDTVSSTSSAQASAGYFWPGGYPYQPINHYRVIAGGDTVVFTRNPYARATKTSTAPSAFTALSYKLKVFLTPDASWLTLDGVTNDSQGRPATVVGKKITGTLNVNGLPYGFSAGSPYHWTITGDPLSEYKIEEIPGNAQSGPNGDNLKAKCIPFVDPQGTEAKWFWWKAGKPGVSVTFPLLFNNSFIGDVTVGAEVKVYTPSASLQATIPSMPSSGVKRAVYLTSSYLQSETLPADERLRLRYDKVSTSDLEGTGTPGIIFTGAVQANSSFAATGTGEWLLVQLRKHALTRAAKGGALSESESTDGYQLDSSWPYAPDTEPSTTFGSVASPALHGSVGNPVTTKDTPNGKLTFVDAPDADHSLGVYVATSYSVRDDFQMYILYRPPGVGSQWVPLKCRNWFWHSSATRTSDAVAWSMSPSPYATDSSVELEPVDEEGFLEGQEAVPTPPPYPEWDYIYQSQRTYTP